MWGYKRRPESRKGRSEAEWRSHLKQLGDEEVVLWEDRTRRSQATELEWYWQRRHWWFSERQERPYEDSLRYAR